MQQVLVNSSKTVKKLKRMPVIAGMQFGSSDNKMRKVGYDVFEHTFQVFEYSDGYKDLQQTGSRKVKRVMY